MTQEKDLKSLALKAVPEEKKNLTATCRRCCEICMMPFPLEMDQSAYNACCGKRLCKGCIVTSFKTFKEQYPFQPFPCAFCRTPAPKTDKEKMDRILNRAKEWNDGYAAYMIGNFYLKGDHDDFPKSIEKAREWYEYAIKFGNVEAYYEMAMWFYDKDTQGDEIMKYLELAAQGGDVRARYNICHFLTRKKEKRKQRQNHDLAAGHAIVASCTGYKIALDLVRQYYKLTIITKEEYATSLRAYHASNEERKSIDREMAKDFVFPSCPRK